MNDRWRRFLRAAGTPAAAIAAFVSVVLLVTFLSPDDPGAVGLLIAAGSLMAGLTVVSVVRFALRATPTALSVRRSVLLGLPVGLGVATLAVLQGNRLLGPVTVGTIVAIVSLLEYVIWPETSR